MILSRRLPIADEPPVKDCCRESPQAAARSQCKYKRKVPTGLGDFPHNEHLDAGNEVGCWHNEFERVVGNVPLLKRLEKYKNICRTAGQQIVDHGRIPVHSPALSSGIGTSLGKPSITIPIEIMGRLASFLL